jgi:hypothetical protein
VPDEIEQLREAINEALRRGGDTAIGARELLDIYGVSRLALEAAPRAKLRMLLREFTDLLRFAGAPAKH